MSDDITAFDGSLTALENRAEVASLEGLHAQRRALLPEYARLRALHGPGGKWDAKRKAMLDACAIAARLHTTKEGVKTTEAMIDDMAHGDEVYVRFVDQSIDDATRYVELKTAITEIEEQVRNREISLYAYNAESRLGR